MFAVVMCLSWNVVSFPPPLDQRPFAELVDDVTWVLTCLNTPNETEATASLSSRRKSRSTVVSSKKTAVVSKKRSAPVVVNKSLAKRARR